MANKSILIAEDEVAYGKILKQKLEPLGFDVIWVQDGEQALKAARERKPDLIFLDLVMPIKDGFETLEALKKDENLSKIPVIALSNLGQSEDMDRVKSLGASEYLVKSDVPLQTVIEKAQQYVSSK